MRQWLRDHAIQSALIAGAAAIIAALLPILLSHGSGGTTTTTAASPARGSSSMTIEDDVYGGAWALRAPTAAKLSPRSARPAGGKRWYRNGTRVAIRCSRIGHGYPVIINLKHYRWRWWARLRANNLWVPMAAFRETKVDGDEGFPTCGS